MAEAFDDLQRVTLNSGDDIEHMRGVEEDAGMAETFAPALNTPNVPSPDDVTPASDGERSCWIGPRFYVPAGEHGSTTEVDTTHTLLLALFLVVLAFFIVLVSYSTIDGRRSDAIMGSLTSTFAAHRNGLQQPYQLGSAEGDVVATDRAEEQLATLFATRLRLDEVDVKRVGRAVELAMPTDVLFRHGSDVLRQGRLSVLDRLVATVSQRLSSTPYALTLRFERVEPADRALPYGPDSLVVRRADLIASALVERGLPTNAITIAVEPAHRDRFVFAFRILYDEPSVSGSGRL